MNKLRFIFLITLIAPFYGLVAASVESSEIVSQTLVWPDGTRYVGGVRDGKRWGKGTIFWQDGTRFVGTFANDLRNGSGTMILPDGTVYNGYFQDDALVDTPITPVDSISGIPNEVTQLEPPGNKSGDFSANTELTDSLDPEIQIALNTTTLTLSDPETYVTDVSTSDTRTLSPKVADVINKLSDSVKTEVESMVELWAAAWSDRNVQQYLAYYSDDFAVPGRQSRSQWEALRRSRLTRPNTIEVSVEYGKFEMASPNVIQVEFNQRYRSDLYRDQTRKQLFVRKEGDAWRILEERSL